MGIKFKVTEGDKRADKWCVLPKGMGDGTLSTSSSPSLVPLSPRNLEMQIYRPCLLCTKSGTLRAEPNNPCVNALSR